MKRILLALMVVMCISVDAKTQTILAEKDVNSDQDIEVALIGPMAEAVGQYERIEFGLKLPSNLHAMVISNEKGHGLNPFDPEAIRVYAVLYTSDIEVVEKRVEAFYYRDFERDLTRERWISQGSDYHWRLRFAPDRIGDWKADFYCVTGDKVYSTKGVNFTVKESDNPGYLERGTSGEISDRYLRFSKKDEPFFAIGENLAWAYDGGQVKVGHHLTMVKWMKELAAAGGNYARVWLRTQNYGVEREKLGDYSSRMRNAWEFDQLLQVAEELGIYLQLNVLTDEFAAEGGWPPENEWKKNPYKKRLGLDEVKDFYANNEAQKYFKRRLRYIISRWGYSTNFAVLEFVTEPDEGSNMNESREDKLAFFEWAKEMNKFVKLNMNARQLTLVSFRDAETAENPAFWEYTHMDIASANRYARSYGELWYNKYKTIKKIHRKLPRRPFIWSEFGSHNFGTLDYCSDIQFHNAIWAVSFQGSYGTPLTWWWDAAIHKKGYQDNFKPLAAFFKDVDLTEKNYVARRSDDKMFHHFADIRSFYLVSEDGEKALGWVQNTDYWWPHLYETNECVRIALDSMNGYHSDPNDHTNYAWKIREKDKEPPQMKPGTKFKLHGFDGGEEYIVKWYDTHADARLLYEEPVQANLFGTIRLVYRQFEDYSEGDRAFKIVRVQPGEGSR